MVAPCEWYAQKHAKCDLSFVGTNYLFSAMVLRHRVQSILKAKSFFKCCFVLLPRGWGESLLHIVAAHGPAYHATCNDPFRKQSSPESMDVSSVSHKRLFDKLFQALFIARSGFRFDIVAACFSSS